MGGYDKSFPLKDVELELHLYNNECIQKLIILEHNFSSLSGVHFEQVGILDQL